MTTDKVPPEGAPEAGAAKPDPASSLLKLVVDQLAGVKDIYNNLLDEYEDSAYRTFEDRFLGIRKTFKAKLQKMSDEHYESVKRSPLKIEAIKDIIQSASDAAERFQEAREKQHLNRAVVTDPLENLIHHLESLKYLIEVQASNEQIQ